MRKIVLGKGLVILLILIMLFTVAIGSSGALASPSPERVRVFINFTMTPGPAEEALVRSFGGTVRHAYQIVPALSAELPQSAISALQRNPKVTLIEPVIKAYLVDYQSELNNTWGVKRIQAGPTHFDGHVGSGVKVAIVDTGIDYNHPDLYKNYAGGYDFADKNNYPMDVHSHGTHVAGTVAALRDEVGVVGAAPEAKLYALKVFGDDGSADYADIVAAIDWAALNGIQITNNSYGSTVNPGTTVQQAFDNAYYHHGVLHVAAAGNETKFPRYNQTDNVIYPAKFESVMAVSASDSNDKRANFSSNGPEVELIAPGVNINSTVLNNQYGTKSGTSMASPHVAGVAALVWAVNPSLTNVHVRNILKNTAEDLKLSASNQGKGLVRADLAVAAALGTGSEPSTTGSIMGTVKDTSGSPIEGALVQIETQTTTTDSIGAYSFNNVSAGEHSVTASKDGYNPATLPVTVEAGKTVTLNFNLTPVVVSTYTVSGTVKDSSGAGLEGATVIIEGASSADTDTDGHYSISNITSGTYNITASKTGYTSHTMTGVSISDHTTLNFTLEPVVLEGPEIVVFELQNNSNPAWTRVIVNWKVSGNDLATVTTVMKNAEGVEVASQTSSINGNEASGTHELRIRGRLSGTYYITLTVTDTNEKSAEDTEPITL